MVVSFRIICKMGMISPRKDVDRLGDNTYSVTNVFGPYQMLKHTTITVALERQREGWAWRNRELEGGQRQKQKRWLPHHLL